MDLSHFWPPKDEDHLNCFITEAETAAEQVFLAVHQPMRLTRSYFNVSGVEQAQTEEDVLNALLAPDPPSGTLIIPIVGDSGVGKSHMIRWLDARLKIRADHKSRHIVRIPKSSSLRGVLQLILRELPGEKYEELGRKLNSAKTPPDRLKATYILQAELITSLIMAGKEAAERITQNRGDVKDQMRAAHCRALAGFLQDQEVSGFFTSQEGEDPGGWGVLTRIADRCLHGSRRGDEGLTSYEFVLEDFAFVSEVDRLSVAAPVRPYLSNLRGTPAEVALAVFFLNEVLESARSSLIDLGGVSLSDLFVEIREALLQDGLELVLLVEDFAVLAGIQGPLLDAMIKEGWRDGKKTLCTMRTALAVTEGKLPEETVRTRCMQGYWTISSTPFAPGEEEDALTTFQNLIGGYLNAARWGVRGLDRMFRARGDHENPTAWVECFYESHQGDLDEEARKQLLAFGRSPRGGYPLFPFNPAAIRQLARRYLYDRPTRTYRFDPRMLINRLLNTTVRSDRKAWMNGEFPRPDFGNFGRDDLNQNVSIPMRGSLGPQQIIRAAPLLYFWGDDPQSPAEAARVPGEIHDAFRIPRIAWNATPAPPDNPGEGTRPPDTTPPVPPLPDPAERWMAVIQEWRASTAEKPSIKQGDARTIRAYLSDAVGAWLDWSALFTRKVSIDVGYIHLPRVSQGNDKKPILVAATNDDLTDPEASDRFFAAMQAVVRYHARGDWDYEGGEVDCARYANFISKLAAQAEDYFSREGPVVPREGIKYLAQALLVGARLLDIKGASTNNDVDNLSALLADAQPGMKLPDNPQTPWEHLILGAARVRAELLEVLFDMVSVRQGTGRIAYGFDSVPLLDAIGSLRTSKWKPENPGESLSKLSSAAKDHLRRLRDLSCVEGRGRDIVCWSDRVAETFGKEFETREILALMRETVREARDASVFHFRRGNDEPEPLLGRLAEKPLGPIMDQLSKAKRIRESGDKFDIVLSCTAQVDDMVMERSKSLIDDYETFLNETSSEVDEKLNDDPTNLPQAIAELGSALNELSGIWNQMQEIPS